jgi:putative ribosome biogenesis GTPase RsgA
MEFASLMIFLILNHFTQLLIGLNKLKNNASKYLEYMIIGNKCDLEEQREIEKEEGEKLAKQLNCPFFEVSALNNK